MNIKPNLNKSDFIKINDLMIEDGFEAPIVGNFVETEIIKVLGYIVALRKNIKFLELKLGLKNENC